MTNATCSVSDCTTRTRSRGATLCAMHYHRQYRHGSVNAKPQGIKTGTPRKYATKYLPNHPLAMKNGKVYAHRAALFDAIGPGVHACHWCDGEVEWLQSKGDQRNLVVDHVNEDKGDNRIENLVACCSSCNVSRSMARRAKTLRASGAWSANDTIASLRDGRPVNRFLTAA